MPILCLALILWGWKRDSPIIMTIAALCCFFTLYASN